MDDIGVDASLRSALTRNRLVLTACLAGLVPLAGALLVVSDAGAATVLGTAGLALMVLGLGWVTLDAWQPRRRPAPDVKDGPDTVVRAGRAVLMAPAAAAVGLVALAGSFLLGPGLADVAEGRRGGWVVYLLVPLAPVLLAAALGLLLRPDELRLGPDGLSVRRLGRTSWVGWDDVGSVEPVPANPGLVVRIVATDGTWVPVTSRQLDLTAWELRAALVHYARNPGDRHELGTQESLRRLQELRERATRPGADPAWFPAPAGRPT